jgi:hypothetical protein
MSVPTRLSLRGATLVAGMSTPALVLAGVLAGAGIAALAHLTGADLRGLAGSQPGLLQSFIGPRDGSA